ncbi:FHA domain-containing protein [Ruminiclostridium herbifermentans]|uniref:FHA domain-containing protein n=1 Tax=Ruminiclostridium herbifermentans TaxID=2488810 RepID=A0A4U7JI62_9FIRM|nr:DUF6382 domain-containing protein [Ruminiclostridium herbifermentans]QNU65686.1 FHA domain-containing protein [Ruminiclostridium herbifermentans]
MLYSLENDFEVLYENDSTSNYLILKTSIDKEILNYQAQMLLHNKLKGLLNFNMNRIGDELNCFYNITSKCTLAAYLSRKSFTRDEFLETILNIINNVYQLKDYLLYDDNILLDENFIYVEPDSISLYFVYLPFRGCKSDIKAFFAKLIFRLVKFEDEYSDNYIQKILENIKSDTFSLSSFKSLIESLLCESIKSTAKCKEALKKDESNDESNIENSKIRKDKTFGSWLISSKTEVERFNTQKSEKRVSKKIKTESPINIMPQNETKFQKGNFKIPNSNKVNKLDNISHDQLKTAKGKESNNKNRTNNMLLLTMILLQPLLIASFILILNSKLVMLSDNPKTTVIILILIFLGIDVLIIRILNEKVNKDGELSTLKKDIVEVDNYKPLQIISSRMKSKELLVSQETQNNKLEEVQNGVVENYSGETVIIKKPKLSEYPYLKAKEGDEVIQISKNSILIGRMRNFVDYTINSSAIGKIHAEILQEEDNFYVMDCNSKNGTFINDHRILPNTKNSIKNNDTLRFANREYIFSNCVEG